MTRHTEHKRHRTKEPSMEEFFKDGYFLVVEDAANLRRTIRSMLRHLGVNNVAQAEDDEQALTILQTSKTTCKFLLLDLHLPGMSGLDLAQRVRETHPSMPVLIISGDDERGKVAYTGEIGLSGYIVKPFVAQTLEKKIKAIIAALHNPPEHVKRLEEGKQLMDKGEYGKATAVFHNVMEMQWGGARALVHLGALHELMGEMDQALKMYRRASLRNPHFIKAYISAAELLAKSGREEDALEYLEKASAISPRNAERQFLLGRSYLKAGNMKKAAAAMKIAVELDPKRMTEVAEELLVNEKPELAETYFRKAVKKDFGDAHLYNRLGISLRRQGKWKEAVKEYEIALKMDPNDEALYFNIGKAYMEGGDSNSAFNFFKKALELNPSFTLAQQELEGIRKRSVEYW